MTTQTHGRRRAGRDTPPDSWPQLLSGPASVPTWERTSAPVERRRLPPSPDVHEPELPPVPLVVPTSSMAVVSAIFGIGILLTLGMTAPAAVLIGHFAWGETSTGERAGHGLTVTGLLLGYLAITFWVVGIIFIATAGQDIKLPRFPN